MRITAGLVALLAGFGLPAMAIADDEIANFEARWPEAPMRKPTLTELVYLVAGALKQDILRIPTIATTYSDPSRPPVTIDRDQRRAGMRAPSGSSKRDGAVP